MNGRLTHAPPWVTLGFVLIAIAFAALTVGVAAQRREIETMESRSIALNARVVVLENEVKRLAAIFERDVNVTEFALALIKAAKEAETER